MMAGKKAVHAPKQTLPAGAAHFSRAEVSHGK
ncbi:hypothetical protein HDC29_003278 [Sphingopyxis sp. JAI108]|nr:hypothetical protein [Sphingopyxis sp. JAI108]